MTVHELQRVYLGNTNAAHLPREDFFPLVSFVSGKSTTFLHTHPEFSFSGSTLRRIRVILEKRIRGTPVAYLTHGREFYGRMFRVTEKTLIPRPETELLVEAALAAIMRPPLNPLASLLCVDVGTGSGCIIITVAKELARIHLEYPSFSLWGLDISSEALMVARSNARVHAVRDRITFRRSDLLAAFTPPPVPCDRILLLANLPYLSDKVYVSAPPHVRHYEPRQALSGGRDGLSLYRRFFPQVAQLQRSLAVPCSVILEFSPEQNTAISILARRAFPTARCTLHKDLTQRHRLLAIDIPSQHETREHNARGSSNRQK